MPFLDNLLEKGAFHIVITLLLFLPYLNLSIVLLIKGRNIRGYSKELRVYWCGTKSPSQKINLKSSEYKIRKTFIFQIPVFFLQKWIASSHKNRHTCKISSIQQSRAHIVDFFVEYDKKNNKQILI